MKHRFTMLLMCALVATALLPSAAFGWGNGGEDSLDDRRWGAHDWAVWQAYVAAGSPAWFDVDEAILASNDPDYDESDRTDHGFQTDRGIGGAPYQVGELYTAAIKAYEAGDTTRASAIMGRLSHYYADVCQPFHTTSPVSTFSYMHTPYEEIESLAHLKSQTAMLVPRARRKPTDVRLMTIKSAEVVHAQLPTIVNNWKHGGIGNSQIQAVTRVCLSQAVNGLADMIAAVPSGAGQASAAAEWSEFVTYRQYAGQHRNARIDARVVDAAGNPLRAVKVVFIWQFANGARKDTRFTDSDGRVHSVQDTGSQPLFTQFWVSANTRSAEQTVTSPSRWFVTTPVLRDGLGGFKTTLSNRKPKRNTNVTARARCVSSSGRRVKGLRVRFVWSFPAGDLVEYAYTASDGIARSTVNVGAAPKGKSIYVAASTTAGGVIRRSRLNFYPQ
ncbi:MAG: hypothetical protein HGB10_05105 [Coriobacteriia bacterium]|nr:hypothetical protein [Coriobacteriia bacterium]